MSNINQNRAGLTENGESMNLDQNKLIQFINLKLAALGLPIYEEAANSDFLEIAESFINSHQEKNRLLSNHHCPIDRRVQAFIDDYLKDVVNVGTIRLPAQSFILDQYGLARTLSIPPNQDSFVSDIIKSYRIKQGVLHNPLHDRRTTKGVFHIAEGGFPIPDDKKAVPKNVFAGLLAQALKPPKELLRLPFTASQENPAETFVSLLLRPMVCPEVSGVISKKSMEIRFLVPGNMVANLDFVESIFGNAGDPHLPENDAALDVEHWTGHTGFVILAPHLLTLKKKDLGLPHISEATDRQKRDVMYWENEGEPYNNGSAFKITCRDERGIMLTVIADNYFGYCKKEVKTQISFSSNLYGLTEEEHAGGAIAFPSYDLGEEFHLDDSLPENGMTFQELVGLYEPMLDVKKEGYAIDKKDSSILYVPENSTFNLREQSVAWDKDGEQQTIKLLANHTYLLPSGYKIKMEKQLGGSNWRLTGTIAEGTLCHKPSTVSGGGKSEISKSIADAMLQGPIFLADFYKNCDQADEILKKDFGDRFRSPFEEKRQSRPILSPKRSLGSVIKLLTPSAEYSDDYNAWLATIPQQIKDFIYVIKRHYKAEWGENWREHFSVDMINGHVGHELKYNNEKLLSNYLRVGKEKDGSWRIYKLRQDFNAAHKIQVEDDITASIVLPKTALSHLNEEYKNESVKLLKNCEFRLFQRPDDCIHRGYDKQAEEDLCGPNAFLSNFEPLTLHNAVDIAQDAMGFDQYTAPVQNLVQSVIDSNGKPTYFVAPSHPRIVDGKVCKNPRYLQNRPDLIRHKEKEVAEVATRLYRRIPEELPVHYPVNAVLPGRRNNPEDKEKGVPALAVYNPIHYQQLPELFMDFICSVTGKSPSTTGFGSEGALTKAPFNALLPITDLNNALVSYILTGYDGFSSAAGYVGPKYKVEHDVSLLIPEIWCRMKPEERDPKFLIEHGYLERVDDFEYEGRTVPASILGYRITIRFAHAFLGRIFNNPHAVFTEEMLKPELQDMQMYVDGIENIVATQNRVAENYFRDNAIDLACPPLKALLHIMAYGEYEGKNIEHPDVRALFTKEALIESDWYQARLRTKQERDTQLWTKHIQNLEIFLGKISHSEAIVRLNIHDRLLQAKEELNKIQSPEYLESLRGTLGADPMVPETADVQKV